MIEKGGEPESKSGQKPFSSRVKNSGVKTRRRDCD
jgi:hypothetical protein